MIMLIAWYWCTQLDGCNLCKRNDGCACDICAGQSGTGTGSSLISSVFLCQYNFTEVLPTHISSGG
jgi:hypothetical protein